MNGLPLAGRCALVTGSSDGLGLSMANALAAAGATVILHGLAPYEEVSTTLDSIRKAHSVAAHYIRADLSDIAGVESLMEAAIGKVGSIDILVNNAVVRHFEALDTFPMAQWHQALAVNLSAALRAIQLVLPGMRQQQWGRLFNMTSVYGSRGIANRVDYVTTKTALIGLTRAVAVETIKDNITCNAICPGSVLTPNIAARIEALMPGVDYDRAAAEKQFLTGKQPSGKLVEASHVADMVVFLCGRAGEQITGAVMPVEGGWLAS